MKVFIIFQNDSECGNYYQHKVFENKQDASDYCNYENKKLLYEYQEYVKNKGYNEKDSKEYIDYMSKYDCYYFIEEEIIPKTSKKLKKLKLL